MRNTKKTKAGMIISALMAASLSLPVVANDQYYDTARVISVTPQLERINTPQQSCQTEYIRESYTNQRSPAGAIIGGIAGGLLGSTIGRGNGRVAAAAVGAGVGAIVGDRVGNNQASTYTNRPIERCVSVDNWQTVNRGYLVTYRYNGRDYTTIMDTDPGDTIRVSVAVNAGEPVQYSQPVIIERSRYVYAPPAFSAVYISGSSDQGGWNQHGSYDNHGRGNRHYW